MFKLSLNRRTAGHLMLKFKSAGGIIKSADFSI